MSRWGAARRTRSSLVALLLAASGTAFVGCSGDSPDRPESTVSPDASISSAPLDEAPTTPNSPESTAAAPWRLTEHPLLDGQVVYSSGREAKLSTILESLGGGVGAIDFDRDGRVDLFLPGGGKLSPGSVTGLAGRLLRATGAFEFVDATRSARCDTIGFYSHGCAATDWDNDGFVDLLVTGYGGLQLFRNQGDGSFESLEVSALGLVDRSWSTSAAWGDLNGDGVPDPYVPHYVDWSFDNDPICQGERDRTLREICSPRRFAGLRDACFLGNGDGTFRDVTETWRLPAEGKGLGAVVLDVDRDGRQDVYVGNDTTANFLLLGSENGLVEQGELSGTAFDDRGIPNGSMGVAAADFDRNGLFDLWVANYQSETFALYRQDQAGLFRYASPSYGLRTLVPEFVAFGTVIVDIDRDGEEDILVSNGHVLDHPAGAERDQVTLALARRGQRFERLTWPAGHPLDRPRSGRGLALGDLDEDGDADFVFSPSDQPAWALSNDESSGMTFVVEPIGVRSARIPLGAELQVETDRATRSTVMAGGGSYLSTSQPVFFVVVPAGETLRALELRWPTGATQSLPLPTGERRVVAIEQ